MEIVRPGGVGGCRVTLKALEYCIFDDFVAVHKKVLEIVIPGSYLCIAA